VHLEDAANHDAVAEHVEVVVVLLAGWARGGGALEDQLLAQNHHNFRSTNRRTQCSIAALGNR
jgi:hypothetical protein